MKKLSFFLAIAFCVYFTLNAGAQNPNIKPVKVSNTNQPYKVANKNITLGNQAYAQKVLWAWKFYDENTLDKITELLTEDVVGTFPDGSVVKGRDNLMKMLKDYRNSLAAASSTVDACTTLKTPDRPGTEVVTIWGTETDSNKDGTTAKAYLNEVWFFNKEGKVFEIHQLAAKMTEERK